MSIQYIRFLFSTKCVKCEVCLQNSLSLPTLNVVRYVFNFSFEAKQGKYIISDWRLLTVSI